MQQVGCDHTKSFFGFPDISHAEAIFSHLDLHNHVYVLLLIIIDIIL